METMAAELGTALLGLLGGGCMLQWMVSLLAYTVHSL